MPSQVPTYWENAGIGLWLADNPIPGETMDALLQIVERHRDERSLLLRVERAKLIAMIAEAKRFWRDRPNTPHGEPGFVSAVHDCGRCYALGDPDFRYFLHARTLSGVMGAESKEDRRGVEISLDRDHTDTAPEPKRKALAQSRRSFQLTARDLARLTEKWGL